MPAPPLIGLDPSYPGRRAISPDTRVKVALQLPTVRIRLVRVPPVRGLGRCSRVLFGKEITLPNDGLRMPLASRSPAAKARPHSSTRRLSSGGIDWLLVGSRGSGCSLHEARGTGLSLYEARFCGACANAPTPFAPASYRPTSPLPRQDTTNWCWPQHLRGW